MPKCLLSNSQLIREVEGLGAGGSSSSSSSGPKSSQKLEGGNERVDLDLAASWGISNEVWYKGKSWQHPRTWGWTQWLNSWQSIHSVSFSPPYTYNKQWNTHFKRPYFRALYLLLECFRGYVCLYSCPFEMFQRLLKLSVVMSFCTLRVCPHYSSSTAQTVNLILSATVFYDCHVTYIKLSAVLQSFSRLKYDRA